MTALIAPMNAGTFSARDIEALTASGRTIGTALGHYIVWLGSTAARTCASRLYFLSREGAWLAGHYARLRRFHPHGGSWPEPTTLAVSRRSTFLPSLSYVDTQTLAPLLAQYGQITATTLLQSLGLDLPPVGARPSHLLGLPLDRHWAEPGVAERILGNVWIATEIERRRMRQREALSRYLIQEGVTETEPLVVADIGWRGTIQDNLARMMPTRRVIGLYLALFAPLLPAPSSVGKHGFILGQADHIRLARRLRFVAPLEFVASGETPSTLEYAIEEGRARAVPDELTVVPLDSPAFRLFQQTVAEGIDAGATLHKPSAITARNLLLRMIETPPPSLVHLFFEAWRDDRYGAGTLRRGAPPLRPMRIAAALASRTARRALGLELAESGWPWGLLMRDTPFAAPLLRRLILGLDVRL